MMRRRLAGVALTLVVIGATFIPLAVTADPALAAAGTVTAVYPVSGSTYLTVPDTTVSLGPGSMTAVLTTPATDGVFSLTGSVSLPPATGSFNVIGVVPVTATVSFIQVGQTTGTLTGVLTDGQVVATSKFTLQITALTVGGIPVDPGPSCETIVPATITVSSGPTFNPAVGGTVTGTYTIPLFNNCGLLDLEAPIINLLLPGTGNTITLNLAKPTITRS